FDLLGEILGGGKTSRLYRRLVVERRLATEVTVVQGSRELSGLFQAVATAAPDVTLDALRDALLEEIDAVCESPVTPDEFERARVQVEAHFVYRLQTVGGFSGKSDQLNAYNVYCGDPGYMEHDRARYRDATTADVLEAASTWLRRPSVSLGVVPMGKTVLGLTGAIPAVAS